MTTHPRSAEFKPPIARQKAINLALQGGGTHGAFTWGVLDRLLDEDQLIVDGITATSAGSINATLLAYGLSIGGRVVAKNILAVFWRRISTMMASSIVQPSILDKMLGTYGLDYSPGYILMNILCQFLSPYQFNPFNINPLKNLLEEIVDFRHVRKQTAVKLFLCATNVRTCKLEIFHGKALTADHVLASSCLPFLMQAVDIDGERYWDGGFVGNPALFPLIYECDARDIILVHVTPARRTDFPTTANAVLSRIQEVSVNSSLIREMRAVVAVNKWIDQGRMTGGKEILVHNIDAAEAMSKLPHSSKLNGDWGFLVHLYEIGRRRAEDWLASNFDRLGAETSINLQSDQLTTLP
jgi:NTE family protein